MPGFRGVGKKKFCDRCNAYMADEYRESMEPNNYCKKCWDSLSLGCDVVMIVIVAFVLSCVFAWAAT